ncbi:RNA-protein complex protein Nop10 [Candidatus Bathyarchaeota archaeon]|nr:RNA-protein complex protein Nop10 [Candidatus Bathyarchaeota archaeon]MBT4321064.1 RNA-protein complex protein Nop10 [Candidatus Bathyarchaeota archaeon]MBT4423802.1 RNA-protein complex protein Nop10 [Candidatus Bathyarchaeota archaeon]MBT5641794.1 RNA-protein complex protein Nop10 [Candidatus Bathyarchaeota archaeon]MBT6605317.1 RNA-protein complex protein Nop10 [Candidatus Bathyarchaeota archaeon]
MVWLLRKCNNCSVYSFKDKCPKCGGKAVTPHPAKYSPDDKYRRYKLLMRRLAANKE